jgi:hypothetical protein
LGSKECAMANASCAAASAAARISAPRGLLTSSCSGVALFPRAAFESVGLIVKK